MIFCGGFLVIYWWRYRRAEKRGESHISDATAVVPETTNIDDQVVTSEPSRPADNRALEVSPTKFKLFLYALFTAYIAVLIRCIYRYVFLISQVGPVAHTSSIPEMALGWGSTLMQNETLFLILDGA